MNSIPTLENILPEFQSLIHTNVHDFYKRQGAIVSIFGGSRCPWCNEIMEPKETGSMTAICTKNLKHIVQWIPWGG